MTTLEIYSEQLDNTGEGPVWSVLEEALFWLDIGGRKLYRRKAGETRARSWSLPDYPGCFAELAPGALAIAVGDGLQRLDLEAGTIVPLCAAPARRSGTRFNDGKVDPCGRLWAGTMQNNFGRDGEAVAVDRFDGALYRFDANGTVCTIEEGVGIANTLAWSPDARRFYFADSLRAQIYVYDFEADAGVARNKRVFFEAPGHGIPDGSAIDLDGCLWNARWDGGALLRITPDGRLDRRIALPVPRPTSCIFGGPGLDTLFVTSACNGLSAAQLREFPLSGSVLALHGLGRGLPVPAMRWQPGHGAAG